MSREVFEYFYDSEELEPYYSELPAAVLGKRPPSSSTATTVAEPASTDVEQEPQEAVSASLASPSEPAPATAANPSESSAPENTEIRLAAQAQVSNLNAGDREVDDLISGGRTRVRRLVSVHALGQYAYCARSAILAIEHGDERDIDEPLPRLTFLPNFDRERIEEELSEKLRGLGISMLYAASLAILMVAGAIKQDRLLFYPPMLLSLGYVYWFATTLVDVVVLAERRRAAIKAEARQPDPQVMGIQRVNWWSMLKAEFEPVNYDRPFRHPELPLEGCPWRVLERGSTRLPVIRSGGDELGATKGELYPKHMIRLAAYALLLEATGHHEVPFGLVFPTDSPNGLAVRITPSLRERTIGLLEEFVNKLQASQNHSVEPRPPENRNRCLGCIHGQPASIDAREIESARKSGTPLLVLQNGTGRTFHCPCGDRFGSAPPHTKSIKLGLTAALD
jgi:hypothetical protein